ncbi:MAG: hypothetical protein QXL22_05175 [Candidatus Nezhaarchaeales archaeon]
MSIFAKADGETCTGYIGARRARHFLKMVHNGIEYVIIKSIAEVYDIMKNTMMLDIPHIRDIFKEWLKHDLNSYLLEMTVDGIVKTSEDGEAVYPMVPQENHSIQVFWKNVKVYDG